MKKKVTQLEIQSNLELLAKSNIDFKEEAYNIIRLNTGKGIKTIKTKLSLKEWLEVNNLKKKKK
jgi:hypothetical protein